MTWQIEMSFWVSGLTLGERMRNSEEALIPYMDPHGGGFMFLL